MIERVEPGPGQESVWDYPRPPRIEAAKERIRVLLDGQMLADSERTLRVLETSHPPVYYIPPEDVRMEWLEVSRGAESLCEWKGRAIYYDLQMAERQIARVGWSYPAPLDAYRQLAGYLAFYPSKVDRCFVGEEEASAQEGDFYGGWITSRIVGPFKGAAGTWGW